MNQKMKISGTALAKFALTLALTFGLSAPAGAVILNVNALMDGPQANAGAGTGSPGVGTMTGTFDTVSGQLSWSITWSGLIGAPAAMHFHGPALPNQNAGVQVSTGVVGPPVVGNTIISAPQATDLQAGLWYLNLHTSSFAGGEIRGQVSVSSPAPVPGPALLLVVPLMIAGGVALRLRTKRV